MVDILFTAHNRREFTRASLDALYKNTNWNLVNFLRIYADDCTDGAGDLLYRELFHAGETIDPITQEVIDSVFHVGRTLCCLTKFGSPVAIMRDFILNQASPGDGKAIGFAKIDNDTIVPPGWLDTCLATMEQFPRVDLLGIEAYGELASAPEPATCPSCYGTESTPELPSRKGSCPTCKGTSYSARGVQLTDHIGGIGVFRYHARFKDFVATVQPNRTYFGFTEWQWAHPEIVKAWLAPALPVFLLDHLPLEPWRSLSKEYVRRGDQRGSWGEYGPECSGLWDWWVK